MALRSQERNASPHRFHSQQGSTTVEFGLVMLPLMAFVFLLMDTAWVVFARSTLQHAAREGVRYGVTGRVTPPAACLADSIRQVVVANSFGFVPAAKASSMITVTYYDPLTLAVQTGAQSAGGGNVVEVSISGLNLKSFAPVWRNPNAISLAASASDVLESSPYGIPPCP